MKQVNKKRQFGIIHDNIENKIWLNFENIIAFDLKMTLINCEFAVESELRFCRDISRNTKRKYKS